MLIMAVLDGASCLVVLIFNVLFFAFFEIEKNKKQN